jgi:hypothetical protein
MAAAVQVAFTRWPRREAPRGGRGRAAVHAKVEEPPG